MTRQDFQAPAGWLGRRLSDSERREIERLTVLAADRTANDQASRQGAGETAGMLTPFPAREESGGRQGRVGAALPTTGGVK